MITDLWDAPKRIRFPGALRTLHRMPEQATPLPQERQGEVRDELVPFWRRVVSAGEVLVLDPPARDLVRELVPVVVDDVAMTVRASRQRQPPRRSSGAEAHLITGRS